jgi:hypothetical protein
MDKTKANKLIALKCNLEKHMDNLCDTILRDSGTGTKPYTDEEATMRREAIARRRSDNSAQIDACYKDKIE